MNKFFFFCTSIVLLLSIPISIGFAMNRLNSTRDYSLRIHRSDSFDSVRKGEITARVPRRASALYKSDNEMKQELKQESKIQSFDDQPFEETYSDGLVPWHSFHWKNRIKTAFDQKESEKKVIRKPIINAKRGNVVFKTRNRARYNTHDGNLTGKRKLSRWMTVSKDVNMNRYYYSEEGGY